MSDDNFCDNPLACPGTERFRIKFQKKWRRILNNNVTENLYNIY